MNKSICRWGILGAANIARKNWQAIRLAENCTLSAVASRDMDRCRQFIDACQDHVPFERPPRAYASYGELLASDEVDAVYIPLPTVVRKEWVIRAAEAGKHVLSEKPAGATAGDVREILAACRSNNVQFMDGVMFMHSRRMDRMRDVLDDGRSIGRVQRITSQFTFGAPEEFFESDIRMNSRLEPLGCLGDLGWYNIRFTLWAMNEELPAGVCGRMLAERGRSDSPSAVPVDFSAELYFPSGASASYYCSFIAQIQQWATISGTEGSLYVRDFVLPYYGSELSFEVAKPIFHLAGCDFNMEEHTRRVAVREYSNGAAGAQEVNLFQSFADLAISRRLDPRWGEMSLKTQIVLDACLRSAREGGRQIEIQPQLT